jgi:hypothetical protein
VLRYASSAFRGEPLPSTVLRTRRMDHPQVPTRRSLVMLVSRLRPTPTRRGCTTLRQAQDRRRGKPVAGCGMGGRELVRGREFFKGRKSKAGRSKPTSSAAGGLRRPRATLRQAQDRRRPSIERPTPGECLDQMISTRNVRECSAGSHILSFSGCVIRKTSYFHAS